MNRKLVQKFLLLTFAIMLLFWGGSAVVSQLLDITVDNPAMKLPFMLGGFSPTIASYLSLKSENEVHGFKDWLKQIFGTRQSPFAYALVLLFVLVYFGLGSLINGVTIGAPIWLQLIIVPSMLLGGGNEEAGWRMILQPELEKKYGFHIATITTSIIWWLWHSPLFFIKGTANAQMNFLLFGIMCVTLSYALAAIRKASSSVFPCVLMHCLINGLSATFLFSFSLTGSMVTLAVTVAASTLVLKFRKAKYETADV